MLFQRNYLNKVSLLLLINIFFVPFALDAQKDDKKDKSDKNDEPKSIKDFIKDSTQSDEGLFTIHQQKGKLHFEIPEEKLDTDMLLVSRISKIPSDLSPYLNAGSKVGEQVVTWQKLNDKILLRVKSYRNVSDENDPISYSVQDNNFQPIIAAFKIEARDKKSSRFIIDVTKLFTSDVKALSGLTSKIRKDYKVKNLDKDASIIETAKSFPINIEVKHITTFNAGAPPSQSKTQILSLLMNQSFILLPEEEMQSRIFDERVGWFTTGQIDYSSDALKSDQKRYINRWKLIPKDIEAYKKGELVEPIKPIVFYVDPATPLKWRKYFKQGIEDWNECFATAGFKNAIIAMDPPSEEENPDFSPEDARYSVVRYVASTTRNAMGPSVTDPRTGEIIESDIIWYHNHLRSYRNRYLLETGAANPKARGIDTPEKEIGEMMRRVISHEVGHALGLPHNMKASAAYPVDSLRSGPFTQKYGIATTIMDYARYNYVAQPGDKNIRFVRQLGPYDHYSINWGYRYVESESPKEELKTLQSWILEKSGDPMYEFGAGYPRFDPESQTECIGDDNVRASNYGLKNLKIVGQNLIQWTSTPGQNYDDLEELYGEFIGVWSRYINHAITNVAGVNETLKTSEQEGIVYQIVSKATQQEALRFLDKELFTSPTWLMPVEISVRISHEGTSSKVADRQSRLLRSLLSIDRLERLVKNENTYGSQEALGILEVLNAVQKSIFGGTDDALKRSLQSAYVDHLIDLIQPKDQTKKGLMNSDSKAAVRFKIKDLASTLNSKVNMSRGIQQAHYDLLRDRINEYLNP